MKNRNDKDINSDNLELFVDGQPISNLPENVQKLLLYDYNSKRYYGHVKPPISIEHNGFRFIAVGNGMYYSKKWKTFHDFLFDYIKNCLGESWGNVELQKPHSDRHPIINWYVELCEFQKKHAKGDNEIYKATCTGRVGAYLMLAYDLYLLRHNSLLQEKLILRLKNIKLFQGARYEIYVTTTFIRAGFDIELEDENDTRNSHCEFNATDGNGSKYSVEAKSRHRSGLLGFPGEIKNKDEIKVQVDSLLYKALMKDAKHTRIVFIDINMPPEKGLIFDKSYFLELNEDIKKVETTMIGGKPSPPAFLFFTNHPYHYVDEEETEPLPDFMLTAVNVPIFRQPDMTIASNQYPSIFKLWNSLNNHTKFPNEII